MQQNKCVKKVYLEAYVDKWVESVVVQEQAVP